MKDAIKPFASTISFLISAMALALLWEIPQQRHRTRCILTFKPWRCACGLQ
jgi:hypothetical protein